MECAVVAGDIAGVVDQTKKFGPCRFIR